jgi:hypothetical protein
MLASYNLEDVLKVVFPWPLIEFYYKKTQSYLLDKSFLYPLAVLMRSEVSASAVSTPSIAISWR